MQKWFSICKCIHNWHILVRIMKYRGQKSGGTVSFNPQQKWMELQEQLHDIFDPVVFMILLYDIQYDTTQCRLYVHCVCQRSVRLRAVSYSAESFILQISSRKQNYLQNHFSLLIRGKGGLNSKNKKC